MPIRINPNIEIRPDANPNDSSSSQARTGGGTKVDQSQISQGTKVRTDGQVAQPGTQGSSHASGQASSSSTQTTPATPSYDAGADAEELARALAEAKSQKARKDKDATIASEALKGQRERRDARAAAARPATAPSVESQSMPKATSAKPAARPEVLSPSDVSAMQSQATAAPGVDPSLQPAQVLAPEVPSQTAYAQDAKAAPATSGKAKKRKAPKRQKRRAARTSEKTAPLGEDIESVIAEQMAKAHDANPKISGDLLNARADVARNAIREGRYRTPGEIRDNIHAILSGSYVATPASANLDGKVKFNFADDAALEFERFKSGVSDKKVMKKARKIAAKASGVKRRSRQNRATSLDAQKNGFVEYDPSSTAEQNVANAQAAADGTAAIIANPLLINIEGMWIERMADPENPEYVYARPRFSNNDELNIEGALGMVRSLYGCSFMDVLRTAYIRLGIGMDSKGLIDGKTLEEFKLPGILLIEACEDIVKSQNSEAKVPNAIVEGTPWGRSMGSKGRSRDDSGLFPILGGTRCYPLGYIPKFLFDNLSRDVASPLHGMTFDEFASNAGLVWINDTQPRILENTDGPLGWQAAALDMAMRGLMGIDGVDPRILHIPEYHVNRTKAMMQAELAEAGDPDIRAALEVKNEIATETMNRWARMRFKDAKEATKKGDYPEPGNKSVDNAVDRFFANWAGIECTASTLRLGLMMTAPLEAGVATGSQQVVITGQKVYEKTALKKQLGNDYMATDYLRSVISSEDAVEAIEVYQALMKIGGRTAVDAFMLDRGGDGNVRPKYKATKADLMKFLERWGATQGPKAVEMIKNASSMLMFGDGLMNHIQARQFLDMAMYEMAQNKLSREKLEKGRLSERAFRGGESYTAAQLEEIAHSGDVRAGSGEALVTALMSTSAGYEAFKTMGITGLGRTTPWGRAVRVTLQKSGVFGSAFKLLINKFPEFHVSRITRIIPLTNTFSYVISHWIKKGAIKAGDAADLSTKMGRGFKQMADAVARISDYQVGMDSADFWVGLRKNLAYDIAMFNGNYILMAAEIRMIFAMMGGIRPPDDKDKITLPEEWVINGLGVPIKMAWFMDDLIGVGLPLAYAWEIAEGGWHEPGRDDQGLRTEPVAAYSGRATSVASAVFINLLCDTYKGNAIIDAIDFVNNFEANVREIGNWQQNSVDEVREYYGDEGESMSEVELRREWVSSRIECAFYDLFGRFTPPIISEILPGSRDTIWDDGLTHSTTLGFDVENYDEETARSEVRTTRLAYKDAQKCRRTQDNVLLAFFADIFDARAGIEYQYQNMPIDTIPDHRVRTAESCMQMFSLPMDLTTGVANVDMNGDGKADTRQEREEYLWARAEEVCAYINDNYILTDKYPELAALEGFVIPADARMNVKQYCYYMLGSKNRKGWLQEDFEARKAASPGGRLPDDEYQAYLDEREKYDTILYQYITPDTIPWSVPRYKHLSTDVNVMYVDSNGNATHALDPDAKAIPYDYGNPTGGVWPFTMPRDTPNNDYNSELWDVFRDENGNPVNDMTAIYDQAAPLGPIVNGRWSGERPIDLMTNDGTLVRGDVLNMGKRAYEAMTERMPDWLKNATAEDIEKMFGIDCYLPGEETTKDADDSDGDGTGGSGGNGYGNYGSYGGGGGYSYYSGGGGGGGYSNYNPRIYSSPRQVYSQRASGMQTRQPYKPTSTYLRPNFYTKGSREAYKRSDF